MNGAKARRKLIVDLLLEDQSRIQVVYFSMSEENIKKKDGHTLGEFLF